MISGLELRDALVGTVIESPARVRYHVRKVIGEGGQGWVYKATYGEPDGAVAFGHAVSRAART